MNHQLKMIMEDMAKIKRCMAYLLEIRRPTKLNKMQILELEEFLDAYKRELEKFKTNV